MTSKKDSPRWPTLPGSVRASTKHQSDSWASEVQTFSDAVAAWYVDDGITGKRFQAEDLRELLVKRGLLAGSELYGRLHKALANDPRFAWSADNATVTINL